ncbi:hypothetical protein ACJ41O_001920 [Fusarium nematophilum]
MHAESFQLFLRECKRRDAWDRLWTAAAWQDPWRRDQPLHLQPNDIVVPSSAVAQALGIPKLALLTPEIVQIVRSYSADSLLWRFCIASRVARLASGEPSQSPVTIPLRDISSWERGNEPKLAGTSPQGPIVRLTLDTLGIKKVERFPGYTHRSHYRSYSSTAFAFVDERYLDIPSRVLDDNGIKEAAMGFRFGRARLQLPGTAIRPPIWDTPSPPIENISIFPPHPADIPTLLQTVKSTPDDRTHSLESAVPHFGAIYREANPVNSMSTPPRRRRLYMYSFVWDDFTTEYQTISLSNTTGLTFFYHGHYVYAIHNHTTATPSALPTFEKLSRQHQKDLLWAYMPISPGEQVMAVGLEDGSRMMMDPVFLIRTKLAGDITVGPLRSYHRGFPLLESPSCLIAATGRGKVTSFGAEYEDDPEADPITIVPSPGVLSPELWGNALFSSAPLEDVIHIRVYHEREEEFCRGILLEYRNGAQRSLGQCRVGVDPFTTYRNASRICILRQCVKRPKVWAGVAKVESPDGDDHSHGEEEGWTCSPLAGTLEFWVNKDVNRLQICEADSKPPMTADS